LTGPSPGFSPWRDVLDDEVVYHFMPEVVCAGSAYKNLGANRLPHPRLLTFSTYSQNSGNFPFYPRHHTLSPSPHPCKSPSSWVPFIVTNIFKGFPTPYYNLIYRVPNQQCPPHPSSLNSMDKSVPSPPLLSIASSPISSPPLPLPQASPPALWNLETSAMQFGTFGRQSSPPPPQHLNITPLSSTCFKP
jgi:hypothetical protein